MELLFKREQTPGKLARVNFKLWSKIELSPDEEAISARYRFDQSVLVAVLQPNLIRNGGLLGFAVFVVVAAILWKIAGGGMATLLSVIAGGGAAYWYVNEKRETIFVRDLLHGRHFTCDTVVELARKEAWLETTVGFLRQVMESAKHWDGTERHLIEPLPKDEARQVILRGI